MTEKAVEAGKNYADAVLQQAVDEVCLRIFAEVNAIGLALARSPRFESAVLQRKVDPFDQTAAVQAQWRQGRELEGTVEVREDGSVYGEYFVTQPHPRRSGLFIEAVVVWGKQGNLRSELRLVPE